MGQGVGAQAAEDGGHVIAAARRHIAARAGNGLANGQQIAMRQGQGLVARHAGAQATGAGKRQGRIGAGHGDHGVAMAHQPQAAVHGLQAGHVGWVAHQPIRRAAGALVQRTGGRHALPRQTGPAHVLQQREQAGRAHLQRRPRAGAGAAGFKCFWSAARSSCARTATDRVAISTKRTRKPGCSSAGCSRSMSHMASGVVPMICQPPGLACG